MNISILTLISPITSETQQVSTLQGNEIEDVDFTDEQLEALVQSAETDLAEATQAYNEERQENMSMIAPDAYCAKQNEFYSTIIEELYLTGKRVLTEMPVEVIEFPIEQENTEKALAV